ncbi:MAG: cobamide remodeling phosphodiesterase CbiR, partial [Thermodesulfobacteriota bacterium]
AGILENVRYLAGLVDDVELLIFESDEISPIPSAAEVRELSRIARDNGLTYTVHLPLDLWLGAADEAERSASAGKVRRIVERMAPAEPFAYVCHLNGDRPGPVPSAHPDRWAGQCRRSLEEIVRSVAPQRICVETLDYPFPFAEGPVRGLDLGVCLDAGHCRLHGYSAQEIIRDHGPRIRVMHLHGVADGRDHRPLSCMDTEELAFLSSWAGGDATVPRVLTMEVFSRASFEQSLRSMAAFLRD